MNVTDSHDRPDRYTRILLSILALGLLGVFAIAVWLQPDPRGYGTHQQLGLPPCQFRDWIGYPCPHCGMTTSFANVVRGRFSAAWRANPLGIVLAAVFAFSSVWCLSTSVSGRWVLTDQPFHWFIFMAIGYLVLSVVFWLLQVF